VRKQTQRRAECVDSLNEKFRPFLKITKGFNSITDFHYKNSLLIIWQKDVKGQAMMNGPSTIQPKLC